MGKPSGCPGKKIIHILISFWLFLDKLMYHSIRTPVQSEAIESPLPLHDRNSLCSLATTPIFGWSRQFPKFWACSLSCGYLWASDLPVSCQKESHNVPALSLSKSFDAFPTFILMQEVLVLWVGSTLYLLPLEISCVRRRWFGSSLHWHPFSASHTFLGMDQAAALVSPAGVTGLKVLRTRQSLHTSEEVENCGPVTTDIHSNSLLEAWQQTAAMHQETGKPGQGMAAARGGIGCSLGPWEIRMHCWTMLNHNCPAQRPKNSSRPTAKIRAQEFHSWGQMALTYQWFWWA